MLYIRTPGASAGIYPSSSDPEERFWSQFRRWSKNGTWTQVLVALHALVRTNLGRKGTIALDGGSSDTHLARGVSNGGATS